MSTPLKLQSPTPLWRSEPIAAIPKVKAECRPPACATIGLVNEREHDAEKACPDLMSLAGETALLMYSGMVFCNRSALRSACAPWRHPNRVQTPQSSL